MLSIGVVTNVLAIIFRLDSIQAGQYFWTSTTEGWGSILYNRYHIDVVDSQKHFPIRPLVRATKHPKEVEVCLASVYNVVYVVIKFKGLVKDYPLTVLI